MSVPFRPTEVDVEGLQIGKTYYFKSKIYNRILYKGVLQSKKLEPGHKTLVFENVVYVNFNDVKDKTLRFNKYNNPLSKINKDKMIHDLNDPISYSDQYRYFTSSNDEIKEALFIRLLIEMLDKCVKVSTEPQHSEVGSLISSFCGTNTPNLGGKKSRRRNRKSRRKTRSRK
jgi:hypothetical protein